jgi:hypothetical protein
MRFSRIVLSLLVCVAVGFIPVLGCRNAADEARTPSRAYVFRWRADLQDPWHTYEIASADSMVLVSDWIGAHREAIAAGSDAPNWSMYPTWELYERNAQNLKPYYLLPRVPDPNDLSKPKVEQTMVENIPMADLHELRAIFEFHGSPADWSPEER